MKYEWDQHKSERNLADRGFGFDLIHGFDWTTAIMRIDPRHTDEIRVQAFGLIGTRLFMVAYTDRRTARRIISLRKANNREITAYERTRHE